jgi:Domain of unknown function (DUF4395)
MKESMLAIDCPCGHRLEGADHERLFKLARAHIDEEQVAERVAADAYEVRFACRLAAPWIVAIAVAFLAGSPTVAWILAAPLLVAAATVTTTNWCLPSFIYGHLRRPSGGGLNHPAGVT